MKQSAYCIKLSEECIVMSLIYSPPLSLSLTAPILMMHMGIYSKILEILHGVIPLCGLALFE